MKEKLAKLYLEFLHELDLFEEQRKQDEDRDPFWERDESFEAFMKWVLWK